MLIEKESKIGEIVAQDFRTAGVFEKYGVDFCCGGKKSINEACSDSGIDSDELINNLMQVNGSRETNNFNSWEPDFLIDYIINNHHKYVLGALPVITAHTEKVSSKHGEKHPEVIKISGLFAGLKAELESHMQKEERMLFPYIKHLSEIVRLGQDASYPPFGSVENPIKVMETEHETAGKIIAEIYKLSSAYLIPEDACTSYTVLYKELKEFEDDLHVHIHLENNILFPKAVELEKKLFHQNY
jgi:regulator of cell morphogenesis and NO signaling